jgi:hypothetical protein
VEQFFLPELPRWASFSQDGGCFKNRPIVYLDFKKVKEIHGLNYSQLIELQSDFNFRRLSYFFEASENFLKPVEEMAIFSNAIEQIKSEIRPQKIFKSEQYNLIWFEEFLKEAELSELKKLFQQKKYLENPTILFSSCQTRWELLKTLENLKDLDENLILIGADYLSPYNSQFHSIPGLKLELREVLGQDVKILIEKNISPELLF